MTSNVARAAERVARESYGRLVGHLARRAGSIADAEDALAAAFAAALASWPRAGVPDSPEAWLLVAARREISHRDRGRAVRDAAAARILLMIEEAEAMAEDAKATVLTDDRLALMFVCAHPAVETAARTPLMLQTVLGFDAARIASAFCVAPATLGQRLVRAKTKIRSTGIRFALPEDEDLPERMSFVLAAIYACYALGWDDAIGDGPSLTGEAIWLARALLGRFPHDPEALGLLALMLYSEARSAARRTPDGTYVPLDRQDTRKWDGDLIAEADACMAQAARADRFGRFQCEAAIQSVHAERARTGHTNWQAAVLLYRALVRMTPLIGAHVGLAAALGSSGDAREGLAVLDTLEPAAVGAYQPYWATRASLLRAAGRYDESIDAYAAAAGMSADPAVRAFLLQEAAQTAR